MCETMDTDALCAFSLPEVKGYTFFVCDDPFGAKALIVQDPTMIILDLAFESEDMAAAYVLGREDEKLRTTQVSGL